MFIIIRYVLWEVTKVFFAALAGMTLMTTLGMGVREGMRRGLPPLLMFETMPFMLPEILGITVPVAVLFAVTNVYGRMSGSNEITALKSAGLSPWEIVWPVLVLSMVLSVFTVSMYDLSATWGRPRVKRIGIESIEQIAYSVLRQERSFSADKFSIAVQRVEGRKLIQPTITLHGGRTDPTITLSAAEAEIHTDLEEGLLTFLCRNGKLDVDGKVRLRFSDTMEQTVPFEAKDRPVHRDWLGMREIPAHLVELRREAGQIESRLAAAPPDAPEAEKDRDRLDHVRWRISRLKTEPYRRWANGFSCLCFVLVGAPVAMRWRFESFLATFFACFLPILVVFYPLLMFQEEITTSGTVHPGAFWTANVVLAVPGLWLMRRVFRH